MTNSVHKIHMLSIPPTKVVNWETRGPIIIIRVTAAQEETLGQAQALGPDQALGQAQEAQDQALGQAQEAQDQALGQALGQAQEETASCTACTVRR